MLEFDEVGYWSQIKLDIVKKYATAFSKITVALKNPSFEPVYIDAISSAGVHMSRGARTFIPGSPVNILLITPGFYRYYLIDVRAEKTSALRQMVADNPKVSIIPGNCNDALTTKVFPHVQWNQYRRGLCILDPYGLHLDWKTIEAAGKVKTLDVFLSLPVADVNGNAIWRSPAGMNRADLEQLTRYWGDDSWGGEKSESPKDSTGRSAKAELDTIATAFRARLQGAAGFKHVPEPIPMRNSKGNVNYYLFFASQKPLAEEIVTEIFDTYKARGGGR
jgi:three-Cys-motif partner protein